MEFGVVPVPLAPGVQGPMSPVDCDVIAIPRGCRHVEAAWRFIDFAQRDGLAIICRLQGKHTPIKNPPPNFTRDTQIWKWKFLKNLRRPPYTFIQPRHPDME